MAYVARNTPKAQKKQQTSFYFGDVRGVDFRNEDTASFRSPNSTNMYKSSQGSWETHIGFRSMGVLQHKTGLYSIYDIWKLNYRDDQNKMKTSVLIHAGGRVFTWDNYPEPFVSLTASVVNGANITNIIVKNEEYIRRTNARGRTYKEASPINGHEAVYEYVKDDDTEYWVLDGTEAKVSEIHKFADPSTQININKSVFFKKVNYYNVSVTFKFFDGWKVDDAIVNLEDYGITIDGAIGNNDTFTIVSSGIVNENEYGFEVYGIKENGYKISIKANQETKEIYQNIAPKKCRHAIYNGVLLVADGNKLFYYDGNTFDTVENLAVKPEYVPTTYISKDMFFDPSSSLTDKHQVIDNYVEYQQKSWLTGKFKESFHQNPPASDLLAEISETHLTGSTYKVSVVDETFASKVGYKDNTYSFVYKTVSGVTDWYKGSTRMTSTLKGQYGLTIENGAVVGDRFDVVLNGCANLPTKFFRLSYQKLDSNFIEVYWEDKDGVKKNCTKVSAFNPASSTPLNQQYKFHYTEGVIEFGAEPDSPSVNGVDNIFVTASKTEKGHADRINKCTEIITFDNRVILTGNPDYPNNIYWSSEGSFYHYGLLNYSERAGTSASMILGLQLLPNNQFLTLREDTNEDGAYAVWSRKELDNDVLPFTYDASTASSTLGTKSSFSHCVFVDDNVFISAKGLSAISRNLSTSYERNVEHRSTLVDNRLTNENLKEAMLCQHDARLYILFPNGHCYIADSRMRTSSSTTAVSQNTEYEWAYLEDIGYYSSQEYNPHTKEYEKGTFFKPLFLTSLSDEELYFSSDGRLMKFYFDKQNDDKTYPSTCYNYNGRRIHCYVDTPFTWFNAQNRFKKLIRKYNDMYIDTRVRSKLQVLYRTEKTFIDDSKILEFKSSRFDFNVVDFSDMDFSTLPAVSFVLRKIKAKRFRRLQLRIRDYEINRPIAFDSLVLDAYILTRKLK